MMDERRIEKMREQIESQGQVFVEIHSNDVTKSFAKAGMYCYSYDLCNAEKE